MRVIVQAIALAIAMHNRVKLLDAKAERLGACIVQDNWQIVRNMQTLAHKRPRN